MISIIIPSYNSEATIENCLHAVYNQSYRGAFEVILADSSNDRTQMIVKDKFPKVRLITFERKTDPGTARNAAIEKSNGSLLLMIDSDCIAEPDWVERMVEAHNDADLMAVGGSVIHGNVPGNFVSWAGYMAEFREFFPQQKKRLVQHIPTCNISYKRQVFNTLRFNPAYYPQEDLVLNYTLTEGGAKILFDPKICVRHTHRESLGQFLKHQFAIGQITARVLHKLPLEGSALVKNKFVLLLLGWALPLVKFIRTLILVLKLDSNIITRHVLSVFVFGFGLFPWIYGFIRAGLIENRKAV